MRSLRDDLAAGNTSALATFWAEIALVGAPLIEPVEGEADQRLVTFLWHETEPVENVKLFEWFSEGDPGNKPFTKLDGSDVWYRTYVMTSDLRVDYTIAVNDTGGNLRGDPTYKERMKKAIRDPLNPHHLVQPWMTIPEDSFADDSSLLTLPDAPPFVWKGLRDVPHGTVTKQRFASELLGNERDIWVYTHPGYEASTEDAILLIQFDGDQCLGLLDVPNTLDNLTAAGKIRPIVGVFVGNVDRGGELPCNPTFANFLADELIPFMRATYRVAPGPESVIASGQSYGGLASAWVGLTRADAVGNVLSQSGSYWWLPNPERHLWRGHIIGEAPETGWLPQQVATWDPVPTRFYMEAGTLEAQNSGVAPSLLSTNRHMRDVLIAKGFDVTYGVYGGGHSWFQWAEGIAGGLIHLAGTADA